jgi:hypothetical protein
MLGLVAPPHPHIDTAAQRPATGLDPGARALILRVIEDILWQQQVSVPPQTAILRWFYGDRYGGYRDYTSAVQSVWGDAEHFRLEQAIGEAQINAEFPETLTMPSPNAGQEAAQLALLLWMPEPDFRLAIEASLRALDYLDAVADRVTTICRNRGIPWRLDRAAGFEWTGDQTIERDVMAPALTILNDPRLVSGAGNEFAQARAELKLGTPEARKQVLVEAACAVESVMKVLLQQRNLSTDPRDTAQKLFEHLRDNGVIAADTERMVLACATPRNKRAGHGAGAIAHVVQQHEAEAFVAAAATAIAFLGKLLP